MKITVEKITTLEAAHKAIEFTMQAGFHAKCSLRDLYLWEHSPSRTQLFNIDMLDIPSMVSVHFVRHSAVGQQHFVMSNRDDRGGAGNKTVNRLSPVNHRMILNAQHLIDMSRKRLCFKASPETREAMLQIRKELRKVDPDLAAFMQPNCVYRGGNCCEPRPCGNYDVLRYNPQEIFDSIRKGG